MINPYRNDLQFINSQSALDFVVESVLFCVVFRVSVACQITIKFNNSSINPFFVKIMKSEVVPLSRDN